MYTANRYGTSAMMAAFVTFSLFSLMQVLVAMDKPPVLDFTKRPPVEIFEPREKADPLPPDAPEETVTEPDMPAIDVPGVKGAPDFPLPDIGPPPNIGKEVLLAGSSDPVIIAAPMPPYPPRARMAGKEGYALVSFTVTETGTVINPVLLDENPKTSGSARPH